MLGELRMDVDQCIEAFIELSRVVFKKGRNPFPLSVTGKLNSRFDAIQLERVIKELCIRSGFDPDALLMGGNDVKCKT
jgi:hypothetical protein